MVRIGIKKPIQEVIIIVVNTNNNVSIFTYLIVPREEYILHDFQSYKGGAGHLRGL